MSNLFKSFSDKKDSAKNSGGGGSASGSLTGRIRRSLFKENSTENETIEIVQVIMNHRIKVSQFQNVLLVSSNLPKNRRNFFKDFCPSL